MISKKKFLHKVLVSKKKYFYPLLKKGLYKKDLNEGVKILKSKSNLKRIETIIKIT